MPLPLRDEKDLIGLKSPAYPMPESDRFRGIRDEFIPTLVFKFAAYRNILRPLIVTGSCAPPRLNLPVEDNGISRGVSIHVTLAH